MSSNLVSRAFRALFGCAGLVACAASFAQTPSNQIKVDQLGYRPDAIKYVIFGDAAVGQGSVDPYVPGGSFTVRDAVTHAQVWPANGASAAMAEQNKASDGSSRVVTSAGEYVFVGDFSAFTSPGTYYVYDVVRDRRSPKFRIADDVYDQTLVHAQRMYFYNRANVAISARHGGVWNHALAHEQMGSAQFYDTQARGDAKDLRGGWYDAGDYNKYVAFVPTAIWPLIEALESRPGAFNDANNIPESGNGRKDLLDEVKVELDWLLKMQETRSGHAEFGGFYNILGATGGTPGAEGDPSLDTKDYYYSSATTWSTAAGAVSLAKGAQAFAAVDAAYALTLRTAAERAWDYLEARPTMLPANGWDTSRSPTNQFGYIGAGDSTGLKGKDKRFRIWAAAELFRLTGAAEYHTYFKDNHAALDASADYDGPADTDVGYHPWLASGGAGSIEHSRCTELTYAYFTYALAPHAGKDAALIEKVKTLFRKRGESSVDAANWSAYRFANDWSHYYWGSNSSRSRQAMLLLLATRLGVNQQSGARFTDARFREVAEETLHYIHGRNALGYMYLSNMGAKGANLVEGRTPVQMYHYWFAKNTVYDGADGTKLGPPPGYLVGGPAKYTYDYTGSWAGGGTATALNPPAGQPEDKSYLDFNDVWIDSTIGNVGSYVLNEPAIYYQAPYLYLLAEFAADVPQTMPGQLLQIAPATGPIVFNGTTDRHAVDGAVLTGKTRFSATAWFLRESGGHVNGRVFSKATGINVGDHELMVCNWWNGQLALRAKIGGTVRAYETTGLSLGTGVWHHLAVTYDGASLKLWLNGAAIITKAHTGDANFSSPVLMAIGNQPAGAGDRAFKGKIDDFRLFDRALSASEVQALATP